MSDTSRQTQIVKKGSSGRVGILAAASGDEGGNHHILDCREFRKQMMKLENKAYPSVPELRQGFRTEGEHLGTVYFKSTGIRG